MNVQSNRNGFIHFLSPALRVFAEKLRLVASILILAFTWHCTALAYAAQEVCVVPETELTARPTCIKLDQLPNWLQRTATRGQNGLISDDIVARLSPGNHRLGSPLIIDGAALKTGGKQLRIEGAGADLTFVSGSVAVQAASMSDAERQVKGLIQGIVKIPLSNFGISPPALLSEFIFGKPRTVDIELFSANRRLPNARWPNTGFAAVNVVDNGPTPAFSVHQLDPRGYAAEPALMIGGFFAHDWADEVLRAGAVGPSGISFSTTQPTYGIKAGQRVWFMNALRDIDTPGEWAYDPTNNTIYLFPENGMQNFEVSKALEGIVLKNISNVIVGGIAFSRFRDNGLKISQGNNIVVKGINVSNIGGTAMRMQGQSIVAEDIAVADIGGGGISIDGGNRLTLTPGNVVLRRCNVARVGRLMRAYAVAVGVSGVGNQVSGCQLRDGPHAAILFHGNDHLIDGNLIERFVQETDDAGAIYTGQDWTERGTTIRDNVIRDTGKLNQKYGANAIYLDDQASGIVVKNNLIVNATRGILIGGGRDNVLDRNIIVGTKEGIYIDARGTLEIDKDCNAANLNFHKKFADIGAGGSVYTSRYPALLAGGMDSLGRAGNNFSLTNTFVDSVAPFFVKSPAQGALTTQFNRISLPSQGLNLMQVQSSAQIMQLRNSLLTSPAITRPADVN